jgi:amino acid transporter
MATESSVSTLAPDDVGLKREMGLIGATWAAETSIIGSGWLFASWKAAYSTGTSSILAWILAGIALIVLALVHAELGAMYPVAGGTARFPHFAYGSVAGISFGFFSWVQAITVAPIECFAVMQYASYYWHGLFNDTTGQVTGAGYAFSFLLMAIFTAVNFMAMRLFNKVNSAVTWWKVAIPVLAIIVLLFHFHGTNFNAHGGFFPLGAKAMFAAIPGAGIVFAYLGFEQADQLAAEVKDPQKNLPRAIIIAMLLGTVIYVLLQVVFIGALPASQLSHGWAALANDKGLISGPVAFIAGATGLAWLATVLRIDAFISPSGTGLIYVTSGSRVGYGLGRNRYYPQVFTRVDKNGVPWVALILGFLFGLVFLLPFPSWSALVGLVTSASVLMYAGAPLSLGALRRSVPDHVRPYQLPAAPVLAPIAFIIANLIIYWSGLEVVWKLGIVLVIGYVIIGVCMAFDSQRPPLDWRSAQWLPVYLIGMGVISWQGDKIFTGGAVKPPLPTGHIPFGWDFLVVTVFSLVIYYWAMATRLPREEVINLVTRQAEHGAADMPRH